MDQNQCTAGGGKFIEGKCYFPQKARKEFARTISVGGKTIDIKRSALWTFLITIGIAAVFGILAVAGVWGDLQFKILMTTSLVGALGLVIIADFAIFKSASNVRNLIFAASSIGVLTTVLEVWFEWGIYDEIWASVGTLLFFGFTAIAANSLIEKYNWVSMGGLISSGLGFLLTEWNILFQEGWAQPPIDYKLISDLGIIAFVIAHAALLLRVDSKKEAVTILRWITIGIAVILAGLIIWTIHKDVEVVGWQVYAILGILDAALTIITPIANKV